MTETTGGVSREDAEGITRPTPTALAAKAFMGRIGGKAYQDVIENRAVMGGWRGARTAGCRDVELSDAIAKAAVGRVMDLFRGWAAECDEPQAGNPATPDERD